VPNYSLQAWVFTIAGIFLLLWPLVVVVGLCRRPLDYEARAAPRKQQIGQRFLFALACAIVGFWFGSFFLGEGLLAAARCSSSRTESPNRHRRE
jgi:hypothetical protein